MTEKRFGKMRSFLERKRREAKMGSSSDTPKPLVKWCPACKAQREHRLNAIGMVICVECGVDNT